MIDTCSWDNPGADRYTGTVAAAVAAYGFPIATQTALIQAFERREFDSVVIDRDTIRGKAHAYEPELRGMHFGGRGRICNTVTRAGWSDSHTETALVFCADGECIAWPAVCGNFVRVTRIAGADRPAGPALVSSGDEPAALTAPIADPLFALPAEPTGYGVPSYAPNPASPSWYAAPIVTVPVYAGYPVYVPGGPAAIPTPIAPIPEPSAAALLLTGFAALFIWRKRAAQQEKA